MGLDKQKPVLLWVQISAPAVQIEGMKNVSEDETLQHAPQWSAECPQSLLFILDSDSRAEIKPCSSAWLLTGSKVIFPSAVIYFSQQSHWSSPSEEPKRGKLGSPSLCQLGFAVLQHLRRLSTSRHVFLHFRRTQTCVPFPQHQGTAPTSVGMLFCVPWELWVKVAALLKSQGENWAGKRGERGCISKKYIIHARVFDIWEGLVEHTCFVLLGWARACSRLPARHEAWEGTGMILTLTTAAKCIPLCSCRMEPLPFAFRVCYHWLQTRSAVI